VTEPQSASKLIACGNELGEGILWDEREGRYYWTDIQGRCLWMCYPDGRELCSIALPDRLASFALTNRPGILLVAFERGIATYCIADGTFDWICRPDLPEGVRFNDGRVDRSGRFVVGTMVEDAHAAGGVCLGSLYRLESDGALSGLLSGIAISNALCFSPDGKYLYHADTPTRCLYAYSYETGIPMSPRLVKEFPAGEGPDGACIDSQGNIWIAIWGGGRVEHLDPDGSVLEAYHVDALQPTCPALGGASLTTLAVTSAWEGLALSAPQRPPGAGDLFLIDANVPGLPEQKVTLG
jgi:L-arabinonolactonase